MNPAKTYKQEGRASIVTVSGEVPTVSVARLVDRTTDSGKWGAQNMLERKGARGKSCLWLLGCL